MLFSLAHEHKRKHKKNKHVRFSYAYTYALMLMLMRKWEQHKTNKWVRSSAYAYAYVADVLTCLCLSYAYAYAYVAGVLTWLCLCYAYACACAYALKPGSHLCDKHNTSDISISISTRKKEYVPFFLCLCLCLCRLCYAYRTSVNQALEWNKFKATPTKQDLGTPRASFQNFWRGRRAFPSQFYMRVHWEHTRPAFRVEN